MRVTNSVLTLALVLSTASVVRADFFHTFDDGLPDTVVVEHFSPGNPPQSPTFDYSVEGGYLRLFDTRSRGEDGAYVASIQDTSQVFNDVLVSCLVNPTADRPRGIYGVGARVESSESSYSACVDTQPYPDQGARLTIIKTVNMQPVRTEVSWGQPLVPIEAPYRIELEVLDTVVGSPPSDAVSISARLIDALGVQRLELQMLDTGAVPAEGPLLGPGTSTAWTHLALDSNRSPDRVLNTTFDDFSSVTIPEPSTLILLVVGAFGVLAYAWRRKRVL